MDVSTLQQEVEQLTVALQAFCGHRTIWRGPKGELVHAEPELELEDEGFAYVATLMQPDRDTVTAALLGSTSLRPRIEIGWDVDAPSAELIPAHA